MSRPASYSVPTSQRANLFHPSYYVLTLYIIPYGRPGLMGTNVLDALLIDERDINILSCDWLVTLSVASSIR
jgi:hypothetical protein